MLDQGFFAGANFVLNILLVQWMGEDWYGAFTVAFTVFLLATGLTAALAIGLQYYFGNQMARAAAACQGGGVGKYSRSNFVHMDCGPVRSWGG